MRSSLSTFENNATFALWPVLDKSVQKVQNTNFQFMIIQLAILLDDTQKYTILAQKRILHHLYAQFEPVNLGKMKDFANFHGFYYTAKAEKSSQHTHSDRFGHKSAGFLSFQVWTSVLYCCPTLQGPRKKCRTKSLGPKICFLQSR